MANLSCTDYEQLLAAVNILNSESDPASLGERTLQSVFLLIPNEMLVFDGFGNDNNYSGYLWYSPPGTVTGEQVQILAELIHEHPVYHDLIPSRKQKTVRTSQYISLPEFHRLAVFNEFYRHIGGETQMTATLNVSPELFITCSLHRMKMDFTDRDWEVMTLLSPHLISAFRNAQFINHLTVEREQMELALEATRFGIITVNFDLKVENQNITATRLLQKYFQNHVKGLPDELRRYLSHHRPLFLADEFYLPPNCLEIKKQDSKLKVRLAFQSKFQSIVILLEEIEEISTSKLRQMGLTRREAEVLLWMTKGKTNVEIGNLCKISRRTVQKHIEHIYDKLGVETRTSAVSTAMELLK